MRIAEAFVEIRPDLTGFRREASRTIGLAVSGVSAKVQLDVDKSGFRRRVREAVAESSVGLGKIKVGLDVDTGGFRARIRDAVNRSSAGVNAKVGIDVNSDGFRAALTRAIREAATGQEAKIRVAADGHRLRGQIERIIDRATMGMAADLGLEVDGSGTRGQVSRAIAAATAGQNAEVDLKIRESGASRMLRSLTNAMASTQAEARLFQSTIGFLTPPAVGQAIGGLVQMIAQLIGVVGGLGGALAPAVGIMGTIPGVAVAASSALGALGLSIMGMKDMVKALYEQWEFNNSASGKAAKAAEQLGQIERTAARAIMVAQRGVADARRNVARAAEDAAQQQRDAARAVADAERDAADAIRAANERVRDARESLRDAQEAYKEAVEDTTDAVEDAAERVADAQEALGEAHEDAARMVERAQRRVRDANRNVIDATKGVQRAEEDLRKARIQAARDIQDLEDRAENAALAERNAYIQLEEARQRAAEVEADPGADSIARRDAVQALLEAENNLEDSILNNQRAQDEWNDSAKKGVSGSDAVKNAQENLVRAQERYRDAVRDAKDAVEDLARAEVEAADRISDAQRRLRESREDYAEAVEDGARRIRDANRRIRDAEESLAKALRDRRRAQQDTARAVADAKKRERDATIGANHAIEDANRQLRRSLQDLAWAHEDHGAKLDRGATSAFTMANKVKDAALNVSKAGENFARFIIDDLMPALNLLQSDAQTAFFPKLQQGIEAMMGNLPTFRKMIRGSASALGDVALAAGKMLGSDRWARDLGSQAKFSNRWIRQLGDGALDLMDALRNIMVEARPLTQWLVNTATRWAELIRKWTASKRKSGEMRAAFQETRDVIDQLFRIVGKTAGAVWGFMRAGRGLGQHVLDTIEGLVTKWGEWQNTVAGKDALGRFFRESERGFDALISLLRRVGRLAGSLAMEGTFTSFITALEQKVMPAIETFFERTGETFGPAFADMLAEVILLFAELGDEGGGLTELVRALGDMAKGMREFLQENPEVREFFTWLIVNTARLRAFSFVLLFSGLPTVVRLLGGAFKGADKAIGAWKAMNKVDDAGKAVGWLKKMRSGVGPLGRAYDAVGLKVLSLRDKMGKGLAKGAKAGVGKAAKIFGTLKKKLSDEGGEASVEMLTGGRRFHDFLGRMRDRMKNAGTAIRDFATRSATKFADLARAGGRKLADLGAAAGRAAKSAGRMAASIGRAALQAIASFARMAAQAAVQGAKIVAQLVAQGARWLWLGIQSLLHAAKVAAAWLIAMGPIALVIAAVVALVIVIVRNWKTIRRVIAAGWEWIRDRTAALWNGIVRVVRRVGAWIARVIRGYIRLWTAPFRWLYNFLVGRSLIPDLMRSILGWFRRMGEWVRGVLDKLQAFWRRVWTSIKNFIVGPNGLLTRLHRWVFQKLDDVRTSIANRVNEIKRWWSDTWTAIKDKLVGPQGLLTRLAGWVYTKVQAVKAKIEDRVGAIKTWWDTTWTKIKDGVVGENGVFAQLRNRVAGWLWVGPNSLKGRISEGISRIKDIWDTLKDKFAEPIRWVVNTVFNNGILKAYNKVAKFLPGIDEIDPITIGFRRGGRIPGGRGPNQDRVNIKAVPGEFVVQRPVVDKVGLPFLNALNQGRIRPGKRGGGPKDGHYRGGGVVEVGRALENAFPGIRITGHRNWNNGRPITTGHSTGSDHYPPREMAIDINYGPGGENDTEKRFMDNRLIPWFRENVQGVKQFLWRVSDHFDHAHASIWPTGGFAPGAGNFTGGETGGGGIARRMISRLISPLLNGLQGRIQQWQGDDPGLMQRIVGGMGDGLIEKVRSWLLGHNTDGQAGAKGVQKWRGVASQALQIMGQPQSHLSSVLRRMNQESGGDPNVVNKWDSNWQKGTPSVGLMQVIGPTYRAYKHGQYDKGPYSYGTSVDPLANILASMKYALGRYGSLPAAYDRTGGYDGGGLLRKGLTAAVHRSNRPDIVAAQGMIANELRGVLRREHTDGFVYAPTYEIDARGASEEVVDKVREMLKDHDKKFVAMLRSGVRKTP